MTHRQTLARWIVVAAGLCSSAISAATYHINYRDGDDASDGLGPATAWKHCPGDERAAGRAGKVELKPGDVVRFKGGVAYHGEIRVSASGAEGRAIVFDGNTDGSYGTGRAILDGAQMITGWQPVESAKEVGGNPRWREIRRMDLEVDLSGNFSSDQFILHRDGNPDRQAPWQRLFLIDGERRILPVAQDPNPSDPFYPDLPADFLVSPHRLSNSYPHKVSYAEGSRGNRSLPLIAITHGGNAPVIEPFDGGGVVVAMNRPATIAEMGFKLFRPTSFPAPETIVLSADGKEVLAAKVDPTSTEMQRFRLPEPVKASQLTFRLRHSNPGDRRWTKLHQIAAFTPEGRNIIEHDMQSVIRDETNLTAEDASAYDGAFVGVHGGNNHVYFAKVQAFDPVTHELRVPHFASSTYEQTRYSFYNLPQFIDRPGEWCLQPLPDGRTRVFLWPDGPISNIGFPELKTAISIEGGVSHIDVRGFLMQRYAGGKGGVATLGKGSERPSHIRVADCEIRFMSGQSGISLNHSDHIEVADCHIHHCPGWTVGIYVNRINHYRLTGNRLVKNSGSGIRHYEAKDGELRGNAVLDHYGMHSSGINFYEGCRRILCEGNTVQNVIAINRSAEDLTFRHNVVDSQKRNAVNVAMWMSGQVGGRHLKNLTFENNTFINLDPDANWATSIFVQTNASAPEGLVIRNNILDRLRPPVDGMIEGNVFLRETPESVRGEDSRMVADPDELFLAPDLGDFGRKPGGPRMEAGAKRLGAGHSSE